jgi:hypothetical protein
VQVHHEIYKNWCDGLPIMFKGQAGCLTWPTPEKGLNSLVRRLGYTAWKMLDVGCTGCVSELLDVDGRHWDYNKIRAVFNPADADALYAGTRSRILPRCRRVSYQGKICSGDRSRLTSHPVLDRTKQMK